MRERLRKLPLKKYWDIIKEIFTRFIDDEPLLYAANIAFYTIFSLPAVLIIVINIAGNFFAQEAVTGELYFQIRSLVGSDSAKEIQRIIESVSLSESGFIATVISVITLLFSATTVFIAIQGGLNAIWGVKPNPKRGYVKLLVDRILSFAMVVTLGFLMMVFLVVDAIVAVFKSYLIQILSDVTFYIIRVINFSISLLVITVIFALIFKFLPDAKIKWSDVRMGAFVTAILFILGKFLISFYLSQTDLNDTYGAAGSFVILLVWVYYSSIIVLLGAEFTQVYAINRGRIIRPRKNAIKVEMKKIEIEEV